MRRSFGRTTGISGFVRVAACSAFLACPAFTAAGGPAAGASAASPQSADPASAPRATPPTAPAAPANPGPGAPGDRAPQPRRQGAASPSAICDIRVVSLDAARPPGSTVEPGPGAVAGILYLTRVRVELEEAPLSQALMALARAAGVNLLPLYRVREGAPGLDRDAPVTLLLDGVSVQEAIEAILAAATGMVDATWQIRGGIVECGPKVMLADPGRRETRVYDVTELLFEIPTFSSKAFDPNQILALRRKKKEISADFARMIVNQVEPDAWREPEAATEPASPNSAKPTGPSPTPTKNLDGDGRNDIFVRGQWAAMHIRSDRELVVTAPDFIHRGIGGYARMVPPEARPDVPVRPRPRPAAPPPESSEEDPSMPPAPSAAP